MADCLDEETAVALVQGGLATRSAAQTHAHVESCEPCRQMIAALARMPTIRRSAPGVRESESEDELAPSRIADRYELGGVLGAGAMGIVYQARDAKLERTVAIKRVRGRTTDAHDRLVREALAMAQLSHPSVVSVFDAGLADGAAFVAMEYVPGDTLRGWLTRSKRSWRAIAELFVQMARGLEAAHAAKLVHGDFKPDNVLVDASSRARIADFGLARTIGETADSLSGTPAYMAPELLDGGPPSAASDQYAWSTSLYEALQGKRPYEAQSIIELREEQRLGPPRRGRVSAPLWRIIERGLATDPTARFPSMAAAASALAALPGRQARRVFAVAVGSVALVSGAIAWTARGDAAAPDCTDGSEQLAEVWGPARTARVKAAFVAAGVAGTGDALVSTLDAYGERWRTARKTACEATRSGEQSSELLDHQMHCLDLRRESMRQAIALVEGLGRSELDAAMPTVLGLPPLQACADRGAMLAQPKLPESAKARAELRALEAELEGAHVDASARRYDAARAGYDRVVAGATRIDWAPLVAQVWMAIGHLELQRGNTKQGDDALSKAIDAASRAHDDSLVADTLIKMLVAVMATTVQTSEAERMIKLADAAVTRAGNHPLLRAEFHFAAGHVLYLRHEREQSAKHHDRALALWESTPGDHREQITRLRISRAAHHLDADRVNEAMAELDKARVVMGEPLEQSPNADGYLNISCMARMFLGEHEQARSDCMKARELFAKRFGPNHPDTAAAEGNLGTILLRQGQGAEALKYMERSFATTLAAYGPEHPQTLLGRKNLADALGQLGQHARARDHLKELLAARERALGKDHPKVTEALALLAGAEIGAGDHEAGIKRLEHALPLIEAHFGRTHDMMMNTLNNLGMAYQGTGRRAEAIATFERAKKVLVERAGPDDLNVGIIVFNLAEIGREGGQAGPALAQYDEAARIFGKSLPPTHATFAHVLTGRGEALLILGRGREAAEALERALPIRITAGDEVATAETELALAEVLLQLKRDRKRTRELIESASKRIEASGEAGAKGRTRVVRLRKQAS